MKVISSTSYNAVHAWLREKHGKARRCQNPKCEKTSSIYQWALKHGKLYEFERENFKQLCSVCHARYDQPYQPERVTSVAEAVIKVSASTAKRLRIAAINKGISLKEAYQPGCREAMSFYTVNSALVQTHPLATLKSEGTVLSSFKRSPYHGCLGERRSAN